MAEMTTKSWRRPQDWVELAAGVVAALSPIWLMTTSVAMWTLIVLGALIAIDGLWSLAQPDMVTSEGIEIVLGALLFISPWVLGFTEALYTTSWWAWVLGGVTIIAGVSALPVANSAHRAAGQH